MTPITQIAELEEQVKASGKHARIVTRNGHFIVQFSADITGRHHMELSLSANRENGRTETEELADILEFVVYPVTDIDGRFEVTC